MRPCRKPCALFRPSSVISRCASSDCPPSSPSTLTYTRAWLRSALVFTSVTVTNPTRGSFSSPASASPNTWRIASSTRRIRPLLILSVQPSPEKDRRCPYSGGKLALLQARLVCLEHVALMQVLEVCEHDPALKAARDLTHVVVE